MPALPPGRDETAGQQATGSQPLRVFNVDAEDVPPFGAMEIAGWDSDRRAFKVQRCTITGRNDLLFNGLNPIPSGMEGQGRSDLHAAAGFVPGTEGNNPRPGDIWGVLQGTWFLSPNYTGYTVIDTTTADRGFCVVTSQRANITEFVRMTGTPTPGVGGPSVPADWVQAELVLFDATTDAWGTPSPFLPVYFRDLSGQVGYYDASGNPCIAHANRVGYAYGQPLYVGKGQCSTTTSTTTSTTSTTTTLPPCTGSCKWDFNFSTSIWGLTSTTCSTGCHCFAPSFCPSGAGPACTYTGCGSFLVDQVPPNCTGTTTTPGPGCTSTTTTPGPGCSAGCGWFCHPARGWVQTSNGCAASCPCTFPSGTCLGGCEQTTTPCVPPPPPPPPFCNGNCRWTWVAPPVGSSFWYQLSSSCASQGVPNCYCDQPTVDGTVCAQETTTPCYVHQTTGTTTTRGPCDPNPTTTTTPGPGNCDHTTCLWGTTDGAHWNTILRQCLGCTCSTPLTTPTDTCQQQEMPCTAPTTTTTRRPPCGYLCELCSCGFVCYPDGPGLTNYNWHDSYSQCYPFNPESHCGRCPDLSFVQANYACNSTVTSPLVFPCGQCTDTNCSTTTTTPGPCGTAACTFSCQDRGSGLQWYNTFSNCPLSCTCNTFGMPSCPGTDNWTTNCITTTTSTTTTAGPTTTTTTTTAAPTYNCVIVQNCAHNGTIGPGNCCPGYPVGTVFCDQGGASTVYPCPGFPGYTLDVTIYTGCSGCGATFPDLSSCNAVCTASTTTTTTASGGTTTTTTGGGGTTTTTTAGGGTTTTASSPGTNWFHLTGGTCGNICNNGVIAGCTSTGTYSTCLACKTANPGATGPC